MNKNQNENNSGAESTGIVYGNVSNASTIYGQEVFHARQGHGYAAEQAEHLVDVIAGKNASLVGTDLAKNGADRFVNGSFIQTKYCETGAKCIDACFADGQFRYVNVDGTPMQIEVPLDKYDEAVKALEDRIKRGDKIPGITDPAQAKNIIKQGHFKYLQAKNIAKAGTVESIIFDSANGAIVATSSFGISTVLSFATSIWNGESFDVAIKYATYTGLKVGGTTFVTAVLAGQLTKAGLNSALVSSSEAVVKVLGPKGSALLANAFRSGKNIYGAAAMKNVAKMLRSNVITGVASVVILSSVDIVNIFRKRISGKQLFKNITETTASVAGGTAGWAGGAAAGAAIGSVVPIVGTTVGGIVGGLAGAFAGGALSGKAAHAVLGTFVEDDADKMVSIIEEQFTALANDYLLTQIEVEKVSDKLQGTLTGGILKDMFASKDRNQFAMDILIPCIEAVTSARQYIQLPTEEEMQKSLRVVLEEIADQNDDAELVDVSDKAVPVVAAKSCKKFECEIYARTKAEGGRNTPFFSNYMPQFRTNSNEVTGVITLPDDVELCMPGDKVCAIVELKLAVQLAVGDVFTIIEGRKKDEKIVGNGTVSRIIE